MLRQAANSQFGASGRFGVDLTAACIPNFVLNGTGEITNVGKRQKPQYLLSARLSLAY
jgi:hypothetical protein